MATLQVIQGPDKGRVFELREGENIVGRRSQTVRLTDGTISREHSRLRQQNGQWMLEDLGSANGTQVNGVTLSKPTSLNRGDQIRCGSSLLVFGGETRTLAEVDIDEEGNLVDAAIVARLPSSEDSIIIPTPEAGARAIGNLRILYDLISEVSSFFNIDLLLERTLDKVFEVLTADRGYIMLIDDNRQLTLKTARSAEGTNSQEIPISRTIINEVVEKQVGILSSNAMSDKRFTSGKSVHDFGIRSAICVPIKGRERILGIIQVDRSVSEKTYSTDQLRLLTAIGFQTGLAIDNVRLYEAAVQSERMTAVGETVAVLSHHIKNILQALAGGIDIVGMGINSGNIEKSKGAWPIVQRNIERINRLILNMLTFSKSREPLLEDVNVNNVLRECIELQTPQADERKVTMLSDLNDMPSIPADSAGLHQAFTNLLTNAMEAVDDQSGSVTINSRHDSMNRHVIVTIHDNGSGIDPERIKTIFTPFYSSKGQGGTGLGLAVAQKLILEHQGQTRSSWRPETVKLSVSRRPMFAQWAEPPPVFAESTSARTTRWWEWRWLTPSLRC